MNPANDIKKEILLRAQRLLHYNELLAAQCDSWLSEEEGVKNMEKSIREREKAQRKKITKILKSYKSSTFYVLALVLYLFALILQVLF